MIFSKFFEVFFSGKVFKFVQAQIHFFALWLLISFVQFISFVKRKSNSTIKQQKIKIDEKRDQLLFSKVEFNFKISQPNEKIYLLLVFKIG